MLVATIGIIATTIAILRQSLLGIYRNSVLIRSFFNPFRFELLWNP